MKPLTQRVVRHPAHGHPPVNRASFFRRLFLTCLLLVPFQSPGANITWSTPANISGDTDVITTGALVYAIAFADTPTNVNGVPFANVGIETNIAFSRQVDSVGAAFTSTSTPFSTLSPAYQSILVGGTFLASPTNLQVQTTISNLIVNHSYALQIWVSDPRGPENPRSEIFGAGGNLVQLDFSINRGNLNPGGPGQFTVGTFTADANFQTITLTADTNNVVQFNTLQLRDTTVAGVPVLDAIKASGPAAMQLIFHGPAGLHYTLLTATNLNTPMSNWLTLPGGVGTLTATEMTNTDSAATNRSRFYRVSSP